MLTFIYVLLDPITKEVRYVGKTTNPARRMCAHRCPCRATYHTLCWLKSLRKYGLDPVMDIVEVIPPDGNWADREKFWIAAYRKAGANLTNLTIGGEGVPGNKQSPETVAKRIANIRANPDARSFIKGPGKKLRPSRVVRKQGHPDKFSPEWKAKITDGMKRLWENAPEDYREIQRQNGIRFGKMHAGTKRGPLSAEMKARLSAIHKARLASLTPAEREARMATAQAANWRNNPTFMEV